MSEERSEYKAGDLPAHPTAKDIIAQVDRDIERGYLVPWESAKLEMELERERAEYKTASEVAEQINQLPAGMGASWFPLVSGSTAEEIRASFRDLALDKAAQLSIELERERAANALLKSSVRWLVQYCVDLCVEGGWKDTAADIVDSMFLGAPPLEGIILPEGMTEEEARRILGLEAED